MSNLDWTYRTTPSTNTTWKHKAITTPKGKLADTGEVYLRELAIRNALDSKDQQAIKKAVEQFLTTKIKMEARKQVQSLLKDISKLEIEKNKLEQTVKELQQQLKTGKEEIQQVMGDLQRMMEKHTNEILRFRNMDLE